LRSGNEAAFALLHTAAKIDCLSFLVLVDFHCDVHLPSSRSVLRSLTTTSIIIHRRVGCRDPDGSLKRVGMILEIASATVTVMLIALFFHLNFSCEELDHTQASLSLPVSPAMSLS
jgi:hypothetical protein